MIETFSALRAIMQPIAESLNVTIDVPGHYSVETSHVMKNGKRLWFGGVQVKKHYVSYHLMPVYVNPQLLAGISPALKKRMQGKSCFNFKAVDATLFGELERLTGSALVDYRASGYV